MTRSNSRKNYYVVTGSRADYGILSKFLIKLNKKSKLRIIVTGSHLSKKFGYTIKDIKNDNLKIFKKIKILNSGDSEEAISKSVSNAITKFSKLFKNLKIDMLILLGDRYEIFAAAVAASINRLKIAHIHGGETTSNALDESFRHSITVMSHLHFVSAKKYYNRVIQLGKIKKNVHLVGSLSVDNIKKINLNKYSYVSKKYEIDKNKKNFFLIYHPETLHQSYGLKGLKNILKALTFFQDINIYSTYNNADTKHNIFQKILKKYSYRNKSLKIFNSIIYSEYIALLSKCDLIIGNSSSGIIEAPSLGVPTVNIGDRQHGRLRARSIFDSTDELSDILNNIKKALLFKKKNKRKIVNHYEHKNSIDNIIKKLNASSKKSLIGEKFYDIKK